MRDLTWLILLCAVCIAWALDHFSLMQAINQPPATEFEFQGPV